MSWLTQTLTSTIGRKLIMALTGLFLISFLVVHLIGNLQLLKGDGGEAFNKYAYFMGHNPLIQTISIGNFGFIILHFVMGFLLWKKNKDSRPVGYSYSSPTSNSPWSSRNMTLLGTIILIFLVVHLANFWAKSKFGGLQEVEYEGKGYHDLYVATVDAFKQWWLVAIYVISMAGLAFHLSHGFTSAFKTLGIDHKKYTPVIRFVGLILSIVLPALFALIPVVMFLKSN